MQLFTKDECIQWCTDRSLIWSPGTIPALNPEWSRGICIKIPIEGGRQFALATVLSWYFWRDCTFGGALFWLRDYAVTSPEFEEAGTAMFESLYVGSKPFPSISDVRGRLFDCHERAHLRGMLLISMLCDWDAYLVPEDAKHIVAISHESRVDIVVADASHERTLLEEFEYWAPSRVSEHRR